MGHFVYEPRAGIPLAVDPRAFGMSYAERDRASRSFETRLGAAIVSVSGPLGHHEGERCDSYEAIKVRVRDAIAAKPSCIVLALDTPGGSAQGCIEASRDIRAMVRGAGIPLVAWTDGMACSAGYALAAAADKIVLTPSAIVGSIGTVTGRLDLSKAIGDAGVTYALITSGARKADGHPALSITPEETAATQSLVDNFASMFFGWVHEARGMSVAAIRSLEAGIFLGQSAIEAGIADEVGTLDQAIASVRKKSNKGAANARRSKETRMTVRAEMESCDLAKLRDAMEMPDQPAQEVVDSAAERLNAQGEPSEPAPEAAEEAKALRAQLAAQTAAIEALRADLASAHVALEPLKAIAAAKAEADRVARIDSMMTARGMATHKGDGSPTERREGFQKLAVDHGEAAAEAAIAASHVPPASPGLPARTVRSATAPEAGVSDDAQKAAQKHAIATEEAAIRAAHPGKAAHTVYREAHAAARKNRPELFARAS